jgi:hypothetical protein
MWALGLNRLAPGAANFVSIAFKKKKERKKNGNKALQ